MNTQSKKMNRLMGSRALLIAGVVSVSAVGALAGDDTRNDRLWKQSPSDQPQRAMLMTNSGNSGAVIFSPGVLTTGSWYLYERDLAPEYDRRDNALSLRVPDATAGWYAWPSPPRPSLNDRDYFTTSSNPNTFVFPGVDGYSSYDRHQRDVRRDRRYHSGKHYHFHHHGSRGTDGVYRRVR
ncbi:MAG: hypothetical protein HRT64_12940, partial [Erythrobacter sp.]|nr:hypothetical protein [Erythrobacter sp.]